MRRWAVTVLALAVAVGALALAVWLGSTATDTMRYPPLQLGDRTVGGPYTLTEYHGDRIGEATAALLLAVAAAAVATRTAPRRA